MVRITGTTNRRPTSEARIAVRMPKFFLQQLDAVAKKHGQNRSEAVLEAFRYYMKLGRRD